MMEDFDNFRLEKDKIFARLSPPRRCETEPFYLGHIEAEWVIPEAYNPCEEECFIYYLHGGGYAAGSLNSHRGIMAQFGNATGLKVLGINYRLAPENPYPAGLDDALEGYLWLLQHKVGGDSKRIVLMGDSAGGGLASALLLRLKQEGHGLPVCAVVLSPWVDLSTSGESMDTLAHKDPILPADKAKEWAKWYVGEHNAQDPLISPIFGDWRGMCPIFLQVGSIEILLSDSVRLAEALRQAEVPLVFEVWQGMTHVWHMSWRFLPEGRRAIQQIGQYIRASIAFREIPTT